MEKLELNFLSDSPFLNSRKQLAQSFSATNSGLVFSSVCPCFSKG